MKLIEINKLLLEQWILKYAIRNVTSELLSILNY